MPPLPRLFADRSHDECVAGLGRGGGGRQVPLPPGLLPPAAVGKAGAASSRERAAPSSAAAAERAVVCSMSRCGTSNLGVPQQPWGWRTTEALPTTTPPSRTRALHIADGVLLPTKSDAAVPSVGHAACYPVVAFVTRPLNLLRIQPGFYLTCSFPVPVLPSPIQLCPFVLLHQLVPRFHRPPTTAAFSATYGGSQSRTWADAVCSALACLWPFLHAVLHARYCCLL